MQCYDSGSVSHNNWINLNYFKELNIFMDITDKDIKSLCHDVGLNDDITGKIVSSYRTRTDAGVKIYLATRGNGVTANYIATISQIYTRI